MNKHQIAAQSQLSIVWNYSRTHPEPKTGAVTTSKYNKLKYYHSQYRKKFVI